MNIRSWLVLSTLLVGLAGCAPRQNAAAPAPPKAGAPADEDLQDRLKQAMTEPDPVRRAQLLEPLIDAFPAGSPGHEFTAHALIQTYAISGDLEKMEEAARAIVIEDNLQGAELLNAMAYAYAEAGTGLSGAKAQVLRALKILDQNEQQAPRWRGMDSDSWVGRIEKSRGYYLDTLAWIDVKSGNLKEAVVTLREALKRANLAAIRYHLGTALEQSGEAEAAAEEYAKAVALGGEEAEKAEKALLAMKNVDAQAHLKAARDALDDDRRVRILAQAISERVPAFTVTDLNGKVLDKERVSDGSVTVIDFWASWCGPCKEEFPVLQKIYESYKDEPRVRFVAVSVDQEKAAALEFIEAGKYTLPVAHEPGGAIAAKFGVHGLPTLLVIGPDGKIRFKHVGFNPELESALPTQIDALLSGALGGAKKAERD